MKVSAAPHVSGYEIRSADPSRSRRFEDPKPAGRYMRCFIGDRSVRVFVRREGANDFNPPMPAEVEPVYAAMELSEGQIGGIEQSKANIAADPEVELVASRVLPQGEGEEFNGFPDDALVLEFSYSRTGDEAGDRPGREVTVFAASGEVLDSQDFG